MSCGVYVETSKTEWKEKEVLQRRGPILEARRGGGQDLRPAQRKTVQGNSSWANPVRELHIIYSYGVQPHSIRRVFNAM